jgi:putative redox protein
MAHHAKQGLVSAAHARSKAGYAVTLRARAHSVAVDEPVAAGGTDTGATAMELLLGALASCTAVTLRMYAERKGWDLGEVRVDCRLFDDGGARRIERQLRFGAALDEARRERLLAIAQRTPVTRVVMEATPIATAIAGDTSAAAGDEPAGATPG